MAFDHHQRRANQALEPTAPSGRGSAITFGKMKKCLRCEEESEDQFDSCWCCSASFEKVSASILPTEENASDSTTSLLVLSPAERRAWALAAWITLFSLVAAWAVPHSAKVWVVLLLLPARLVVRAQQPKDARWPLTFVAVPYTAFLFFMSAIIALFYFGS